jgi:hypothetical protein
LLSVYGEADFKTGFPWAGLKLDFTSMAVGHYAVADDKAKAGAGADGLGREKWLEEARLDI